MNKRKQVKNKKIQKLWILYLKNFEKKSTQKWIFKKKFKMKIPKKNIR